MCVCAGGGGGGGAGGRREGFVKGEGISANLYFVFFSIFFSFYILSFIVYNKQNEKKTKVLK